jgi:rhodanese-related sulfurtransferase
MTIEKITPQQLNEWKSAQQPFQLIDVRETYEFEEDNIGGKNIPLAEIVERRKEIDTSTPALICCKTGKRSAAAVHTLQRKFNYTNLYSLEGGVEGLLALK